MKASLHATGFAAAAAALLLAGVLVPTTGAQTGDSSVTLAVLGETHGTRTITKTLASHAAAKGAEGCVCPGDFIYGDSGATPQGWRDMMRPFMGRMLPAQGNHDWPWGDWQSLFPGGKPYYSTDVNGVQFIALNPEHSSLSRGAAQRVWLEGVLAERDPSALKVVFLHRPWWLPDGARHPASSFEAKAGTSGATMDGLMRTHGVDLVVSGHEKNYQHSLRDGVHYLVQGGTGPEWDKYGISYELPGALKRLTTPVGSVLHVSPTRMTLESYDKNGAQVEQWSMFSGPASAPAPSGSRADVSFAPSGGSEWWVQANVGGADASRVAKVEARDDDTPWSTLSLRSWGAWAGSFHVQPGHRVQYRATLTDGRVAESCAYAHPTGGCAATATPAAADVSFAPSGGNEWWIQARLSGADAARVTRVEARDDDTSWTALSLRSWGAWAGSFHVQPGHGVQYRATLSDGRVVESCAYAHPAGGCAATATPAAPAAYAADFSNPRGNEWWVEVDARGAGLAGVDARVDGGAWTPLTATAWGSWAKSLRAPSGATVEFRARDGAGAEAVSAAYAWPPR